MDVFPPGTIHEKQATSSVSRNTELDTSWSINPDGFTLMAACDSDQLAQETKGSDGKMYGAFTYHLMDVLKNTQPNATLPSYRLLCDQIPEALSGSGLDQKQTPGVYGRDRLAFLGNHEAFGFAPLVSVMEQDEIIVPMGRLHAVYPGTEFRLCFPWDNNVVRVTAVEELVCRARL